MKEKEEIKIDETKIQESSNSVILDVPDYVYISKKGKLYYPNKTAMATVKLSLEEANNKGYKPSVAYQKFVEKVYEEYQKNQGEK